ncbi:glycosyltransferase family 2 protein [Neobacillus sp. KR4-4]|uniref:glycosyltransferase family 2 protein n=1 Tax=Neobacillus sp. KR4-4 TaxID=3344872 RepID=UPI0035C9925C
MKSPLVSLILPTYNVEKFLKECLESISNQTYGNIEIIVVIDGATDNSYDIAKTYADKDTRFKVFWQENAGSGPARNKGLSHASGELIMFVDPDDWIEPNMLEEYVKMYEQYGSDLIITGYYEEYMTSEGVIRREKHLYNKEISTPSEVHSSYVSLFLDEAICAPTRILYKKSIIVENHISFPDLRRSQDIVFNYRYYNFAKSVLISEDIFYHYRIESAVYLQKYKVDYYKTLSLMYNEILDLHRGWNIEIPKNEWVRFNNRFLVLIGYYIESCLLQKNDYKPAMDDETLKTIAIESKPIDFYHRRVRKAFLSHNKSNIELIVGIKMFVRRHLHFVFECFRKVKKY